MFKIIDIIQNQQIDKLKNNLSIIKSSILNLQKQNFEGKQTLQKYQIQINKLNQDLNQLFQENSKMIINKTKEEYQTQFLQKEIDMQMQKLNKIIINQPNKNLKKKLKQILSLIEKLNFIADEKKLNNLIKNINNQIKNNINDTFSNFQKNESNNLDINKVK